jgi:RND family efflux transporter MFP subunit
MNPRTKSTGRADAAGPSARPRRQAAHTGCASAAPAPGLPARSASTLAVLAALALLAAACGGADPAPAPPESAGATIRAEIAIAEPAEVAVTIEASGSVEAWQRVSPGTKIMGRVSELSVREGDRVRAGQVIARLESADLAAALAQARAAVEMAEATLENAATHAARMRQLHAQRSVTDKNLEDAVAAHRVAAANVEVARANLAAAEVMLSYAEITAPISGWVIAKMVHAGDMAAPGHPLLVIEDLSRVKVNVNVPESVVAGLTAGAPVAVTVLGRTRTAAIDRIVPAGDPATRTFTVQMVLDNPGGELTAGMFARAAFDNGNREAVLVPASAVVERGQLTGVFVLDDGGRATLRWIKLGPRRGERFEVLSGLQAGERYLTSPGPEVHDGANVEAGR